MPSCRPGPGRRAQDRHSGPRILQATSTAFCVVRKSLKTRQRGFDDSSSPSAKTPYADSLSVRRLVLKSPGIRPFFADGCSPRTRPADPEPFSGDRLSLWLLYSVNGERQLLRSSPSGIGQPCRVRASLRGRRRSPHDGIRRKGRTICSTAMSLSRPPQRADLPFPSSPARDIPPPGGGARRAAASAAARCFMRWLVVPTGTLFRWPTCDGG
jgi:hypothetical protein